MFKFWGDGSQLSKDLVDAVIVRSTENFNWTFIFILAVVFYVYWSEIKKKEPKTIRDRLMQKTKKELVETIIQLQEENTDLNVQISDLQEEICIARS